MNIISFKKNAAHNVLGLLLPTLIFLVITPAMIDKLGVAGFGIVTLVQVTTGYMNALNLGFSEALIKHIAEFHKTDQDHTMRIMWTGLAVFVFAGLAGCAIIYGIAPWLVYNALEIPDELKTQAITALKIGAAMFFLQMVIEFYRGSALGHQRFDIPNVSRILRVTLSAIFILITLHYNGDITSVMYASLLGLLTGLVTNFVWFHSCIRLHPIRGEYVKIFKEMFNFTKHIFATYLFGIFSNRLPQFVLGSVTSISSVAYFDVPIRAGDSASSILTRALQVVYPAMSAMDREKREAWALPILRSVMTIQLFFITPACLMILLEGDTLISLWIDRSFADTVKPILFMIVMGYYLRSLNNLPYYCAMSMDRPNIISKYAMLRLLAITILIYPMVKAFGLAGAAGCFLLTSLLNIGLISEVFSDIFRVNVFRLLQRPLAIHATLGTLLYLFYFYVYKTSAWYTPAGVLPAGLLYIGLAFLLGALTDEDRRRLLRLTTKWR